MPNYFNGMYNGYQQVMQQAPQGVTMIDVRSEDEMIRYPVAPGNSLSFRNVTSPFIYTKTLFSQFAQPVVKKYRLVEETAQEQTAAPQYALKSDLDALAALVAGMQKETTDE